MHAILHKDAHGFRRLASLFEHCGEVAGLQNEVGGGQ
jgi:hypothetical protein